MVGGLVNCCGAVPMDMTRGAPVGQDSAVVKWRLGGRAYRSGGYAAWGSSSSSTRKSGYQRRNTALSSWLSVLTRVCSRRWAARFVHCICCFLQKRLLTTWFTVDSKAGADPFPVAVALASIVATGIDLG